jgi:two-component sensor histidine kinase/PAS domain-containing protein
MVVSPADAFFLVTLLGGLVMCGLGYHTYRTWDQPGTTPFVVFVLVVGVGVVMTAILSLAEPLANTDAPLWSALGLTLWAASVIPWIAFALQYTGTYTRITRRVVALLALPILGFPLLFSAIVGLENPAIRVVGSLSALYLIGLMTIGCYLIIRTTHQYGHLSIRQGVVLALIPILLFVAGNFSGPLVQPLGEAIAVGVYTVGVLAAIAVTGVSLFGYDTFRSTPAVGTIGERAIVRHTDDLMFVVDEDERVIRLNRTAANRLSVSKTDALGDPLSDLIGASVGDLQDSETIELMTDEGSRQFDPALSRLTDQHGRNLGHTLSLHDVTELELREQRLEVLNRVLRHNLRNQVEVIRSNAEALADESTNGYADSIIESADRLSELGRSARSIDTIVSQPSVTAEVDLASVVRETVGDARGRDGVGISLSVPESATVVTERHAFVAAAESAIQNALSRAAGSVTVTLEEVPEGYSLTVVDDGSSMPDDEIASVSAGTETPLQHATGIGLWQLKWAVTKFNGDLSIENDDGTAVEIRIPDQRR